MKPLLWNTLLKAKTLQKSLTLTQPQPDLDSPPAPWMAEQIEEDLSPFKGARPTCQHLDAIMADKKMVAQLLFARYRVRNNRVTVQSYPSPVFSRVHALTSALNQLTKWKTLPDVDFLVTLHDVLCQTSYDIPIFAFAKDTQTSFPSVLMPDFEALAGYRKIDNQVDEGNQQFPWEKKIEKCLWRGITTGGENTVENFLTYPRARAVTLSHQNPTLLDAHFTRLVQTDQPDEIHSKYSTYFGPHLSIPEHVQYKYQLLIDGNSCAYSRAYWALLTNCAVLKQESTSIQWYYRALKSGLHYLPVKNDLTDLIDVIHSARQNDKQARDIALAGRTFVQENLTYPRILQYLYLLLIAYSKI